MEANKRLNRTEQKNSRGYLNLRVDLNILFLGTNKFKVWRGDEI